MNRRVISAFLLIVMLISLFPVQAFATDAAEDNPAVLSDVENGETTPSEDEIPGEEVNIPDLPEEEYEAVPEEPENEEPVSEEDGVYAEEDASEQSAPETPATPSPSPVPTPIPTPSPTPSPDVAEEETFTAVFEDKIGSGFEFALTGKTDNTYKAGETLSFGFTDNVEKNADKDLYENFTWTVTMKNAEATIALFVGANEDNSLFTLYSDEAKTTPAAATGDAHIVLTGKTQKTEQRTEYNVTKLGSGNNEEALIELPTETVKPGESYTFKVRTHDMTETELQIFVSMGGSTLELDGVNLSRTIAEDELGVYHEYTVSAVTGDITVQAQSAMLVQCRVKFADAYNSNATLKYSAFDYTSTVLTNYSSQTHIGEVAYNGKGLTFTILNRPLYKKSDGTFNVDGSSPDPNTGYYNYDVTATMGGKTVTVSQYNGEYYVNNGGAITGDVLIKTNLMLTSYECAVNGVEKVTITNRETFINSAGKTAYTGRRSDRPKYRYLFAVTANPAQTQKIYIRQYSGTTTTKRTFMISDSKTTSMVYGDLIKGNIAVTALAADEVEVYVTGTKATNVNFDSVLHNYSFYHGGIAKKGVDFTFTVSPATKITIKSGGNTLTLGKEYTAVYDEAVGAYVYKIYGAYMTADIQIGAVLTAVASGTCGENLTWVLDEDGVLTINGEGEMTSSPWKTYSEIIKTVVIKSGVENIRSEAFSNCSNLTSVTIPDGITTIAYETFCGCSSLTSVKIPDSVMYIGWRAFSDCSSLANVTIPDSVTSIEDSAFSDCISLANISIGSGVTSIEEGVFSGCVSLKDISIGDSVTNIGSYAYSGCSSLTNVIIPDSVTSIGDRAFSGCTSLASISIGNDVTSIGNWAFSGCSSLVKIDVSSQNKYFSSEDGILFNKSANMLICFPAGYKGSYTIPESVLIINSAAFSNCTRLTSVTISDGVTTIGSNAFYACNRLTNVTIPDSVTNLGNYAFSECEKLASVKIGNGVKSIGSYAFSDCRNLTSVTIPDGVTSIGSNVFANCGSLKNVTIPDSVTSIGEFAFGGCNSLTSVTIPGSVKNFGRYAFSSCNKLASVTIGSGITNIGAYTFTWCHNLTNVTIPESVTSISAYAFQGCYNIKNVYYSGNEEQWSEISIAAGNEYLSNAKLHCTISEIASGTCGENLKWVLDFFGTLTITGSGDMPDYSYSASAPWKANKDKIKEVIIESGVSSVGSYAFSGCGNLASVTMADTVTNINACVFYDCQSLASIELPSNVASIGSSAFWGCSSLAGVTIPERVTSIGSSVFYGCSGLTNVTIPENVTTIGNGAFSGCESLASIELPEGLISIGRSAFYNCAALTSITIPDRVTSVGSSAFSGCSRLTSAAIGTGLSSIGAYTFEYCARLTSVTIPANVLRIGANAFSGCEGIKNVYYIGTEEQWKNLSIEEGNEALSDAEIHCTVTQIASGWCGEGLSWTLDLSGTLTISGEGAMTNYSWNDAPWNNYREKIKTVIIEPGVTSIGACAFYVCYNLASVTIPEGVTSIGDYAFNDCNVLTSVTIPDSVTSIGENAFSACNGLKSLNVGEGNEYYSSIDGVLFDKEATKLIRFPATYKGSYIIPDSVTTIGDSAFSGCSGLTDVTIPDSVTSIGSGAFSNCRSLTSITIPEGVMSIRSCTFQYCVSLENVTIPESVTRIESNAFFDCDSLTFIEIPDSVSDIDEWAFFNCTGLTNIIVSSANDYYTSVNGVLFDKSAAKLICYPTGRKGEYAIPDGVTSIGSYAFYNCKSLTNVIIPDSVTNIGYDAFSYCTGLTGVTIPSSLSGIGSYVFSHCTGLTSVVIPGTVTNIYDSAFSGCSNLKDVYYSGIIEQWNAINVRSGNECLTQANIHCTDLELSLDREYITMSLDDEPVTVTATITPTEWAGLLTWSAENPKDKGGNEIKVISVGENGKITPFEKGTAYVVAEVKFNDYSITARCRVDVTENPTAEEITGVQLGATSVTSELYSRDYAEFDILLVLPQNISTMDTGVSAIDKPEDNGVAIKSAEFDDPTAKALFDLIVVDDRRLAVVPNIEVKDDDGNIDISAFKKSSYSSKVNVYVEGCEKPYTTETGLKLTVKKSMPKLKATVATFNSFYSDQSNTIEITGATVTEIKPDTTKKLAVPAWLNLSESGDGVLSIAEDAIQKSASGSVYLKVYTEEWAVPASVTFSVKNTYKAPKLKLSSSSVKFSAISSMGVGMNLMSAAKNEYIWDYNITDLTASDGFIVEGFEYGSYFTLKAPDGNLPGKITLYVHFSDTENTVPITLSVSKVSPTIKLGTSSVTLNPKYDDSTAVYVTTTPSNYNGEVTVSVTDAKNNSTDEIKAWYEYEGKYYNNSRLYVQTNDSTKYNSAYKVTVSIPNTKSKTVLTVKTCKENVKPTLTLKSSGAIDLTYPYNLFVINTVFKNYSGDFEFLGGTVTETKGKTKIGNGDISKYFTAELDGKYIYLRKAEKAKLTAGNTYTVALNFKIGDETISASAKITVKQTAVTIKLSKTALTLNKLTSDSTSVTLTTNPKYYSLGKPVIKIMDKSGKNSADGKLDVSYSYGWDGTTNSGKLTVAVNDRTVCGETYKVLVSAGEGYKATTLTVTVPTEAKSKVSATLKAKGSIDTSRDDTKIILTPTYKNTLSSPIEETIEVYSSADKFNKPLEENPFDVNGLELTNISADSTLKYKVRIVATFENGQTVSSPLISITVKTGTAKMKVSGTPTLYLKDKNSRGKFTLTSEDLTLNAIKDIEDGGVEIKDQKYRDMFELYDYGNGQYAIGFKDNKVSEAAAKLKSASIPLNIRHTGNNTAKPDSTVTLKVTIVK